MELQISHHGDYELAIVVGSLDDSASRLFRERLHPLVGKPGATLILDLSKSPRINSVGLGQLVVLAANANTNSSRVILAACSKFISIVLERSRLHTFFEVTESLSEAVERVVG